MTAVSGTSSSNSIQGTGAGKQAAIAKDLKALADALKKGDKKAAQAAMKQLQIDSEAAATPSSPSSSSSAGATDLAQVASALNSGDLTDAQKAFSTFESNAAAFQKSRTKQDGIAEDSSTSASSAGTTDSLPRGSTFSVVV